MNELFQEEILPAVREILHTLILLAVPAVTALLLKLANDMRGIFKKKADCERNHRLLGDAEKAVEQAVRYVGQTYVDELKRQGKFALDAQKEAMLRAQNLAIGMIYEESANLINVLFGDFDTWLETKVAAVIVMDKRA